MVIYPRYVFVREFLLQRTRVRFYRVQNAALAIQPSVLVPSEQTLEEPVRDHLRRQWTLICAPAHVALHAAAKRFLRNPDLQRPKARCPADPLGDQLINRRARGSVPCIAGTR